MLVNLQLLLEGSFYLGDMLVLLSMPENVTVQFVMPVIVPGILKNTSTTPAVWIVQ